MLRAGDSVSIDQGELAIGTHDGRPVPIEWLRENELAVTAAVCNLAGQAAYRYCGYSTGAYGDFRGGGVTLRLRELNTGLSAHVIFNVDVNYGRNTKHHRRGDKMPRGQFRAKKEGHFCRLWQLTGMALPQRLSAFHDRMGKLSAFIYTGEVHKGERLSSQTFQPLCLDENQLRELLNIRTIDRTNAVQVPYNYQTMTVQSDRTREALQHRPDKAISAVQGAGTICYEKKLSREDGIKIPSSDGSHVEWLREFNGE